MVILSVGFFLTLLQILFGVFGDGSLRMGGNKVWEMKEQKVKGGALRSD